MLYEKYNDHVEITGCNEDITDVRIPAEIEGLPVTEIGVYAFYECSNLESITIENPKCEIYNSESTIDLF